MVRVRTAFCGICATDLEMIAGWERTGFPSVPGHEWSGMIDAAGPGVDDRLIGTHCVAENVLAGGGEVGFEAPGGYGEYLLVDANNLYFLPPDFPLQLAALVEPLAVCVRAVERLRIENRRNALVFGDGAIGLLMALLLKRESVEQITLVGRRPFRMELARQLGVGRVVNYQDPSIVTELQKTGYANIVEASGSPQALNTAFTIAPHGAHLLVMGDYGAALAGFTWNDLLHGEIELIGSNASSGMWKKAVDLALSGDLPLGRLATHRFSLDRFTEAFALAHDPNSPAVRVLLDWKIVPE